jgi:organic radical activating enzyme
MYQISEKFKSIQGEGAFAGTPMAFIRLVGCSVGKKVCSTCDTDFEKMHGWRGGGEFEPDALIDWIDDYDHVCLTGGEPLDYDLLPLIKASHVGRVFHLETSGTKPLDDLLQHVHRSNLWICVSPKPGYLEDVIEDANEVKVIVPGLGNGPGWPQLDDALRWAKRKDRLVFLQPRNGKFDIDQTNLRYVQDLLVQHPNLRLSVQMHKILKVQ